MNRSKALWMGTAGLITLACLGLALAQPGQGGGKGKNRGTGQADQGAQPGQPGQPGGPRGNFDPAQRRDWMTQRMKDRLGVTNDEEWKALQPKVEKVMTLSRDTSGRGGMGGMFGRGGRGGGPNPPPDANIQQSPVEKAASELQQVLDNTSSTADQIKAKLTALRQAREKAKEELAKAQQDLKQVLTQRQEAVMVVDGYMN